jgi:mono/diheme cytochrome c family protein
MHTRIGAWLYRRAAIPAGSNVVILLLLAAAAGCEGSVAVGNRADGSGAPSESRAGQPPTWPEVAPVFAQYCVVCHSGEAAPFGLRLDSYEAVLAGSQRGEVVRRGAPEESELIRRLRGTSQPRMPLVGPPLPDSLIARIAEWIAAGAPRGHAEPPAIAARRPLPAPGAPGEDGEPAAPIAGGRVRLHGTLDTPSTLDGLPLVLPPGARVEARPGDYVEVRGRLDEAGRVRVERMRRD